MFTDRKIIDDSAYGKDNREAGLHGYLFNSFGDGDFHVLQLMYNKLKLNDNKRLLERMNSGNKLFSEITDSIYYDIVGITIDEVIYKGNEEVRLLLEDYAIEKYRLKTNTNFRKWIRASENENREYNNIYFDLQKELDKLYGYAAGEFLSYLHFTYCHSIISISKEADPWDIIRNNPNAHVKLNSLEMILEQRLGTENISESKLLQRYIKKSKEQLFDKYFDSVNTHSMAEQFYSMFGITGGGLNINAIENKFLNDDDVLEDRLRFTFQTILEANGLSNFLVFEQDKQTIEKKFDEYFELACKAQLAGYSKSKHVVMSNFMRNAEMAFDNVTAEMLTYHYFDKLCKMINQLQRKRYQSFSFGNDIGKSDEQILMEENIKLSEQIDKLKVQLSQQSDDINVLRNQLNRQVKIEERPYIEQLGELEKQILRLNDEIAEQKEFRESQNEYIELIQRKEDEKEYNESVQFDKLNGIKPLFVGGIPDVVNKVKDSFPSYKWISDESGRADIAGVTHIIMFYDFMNHALFYKVINIARSNNIPVIYCKGTNVERILGYISAKI
nr:hypothetical protein [uncultured Anaerosporobacter sp.]